MTTSRMVMFAASLAFAPAGATLASEWEIDTAHSTAQFSVRHMMVSNVRGQFDKVTGTIDINDKDMTRSSMNVTIDATTINTRDAKRDAHLKSPDFFDVEKTPNITFKSTKIERAGDHYKVTGDLTMHGVTHPVTLTSDAPTPAMKNPGGRLVRGVSATGKLNRKNWGLAWNKTLEAGGVLVGEEVTLQIDAELGAKAPPPASAAK